MEQNLVQLRVTRENLVPLPILTPYFVLGLLAFLAAPLFLWIAGETLQGGAYRHPILVATVHLYALGWGTAIALGALQQLSPVLAGSRLYSLRFALVAFVTYATGLLALLTALLYAGGRATPFPGFPRTGFILAALLLPAGLLLALANVILTQRNAPMTRQGVLVRPFLRGATVYLLLTATAGGALALHLATGWLGSHWSRVFASHVALGTAGWFLMLVLGVAYHMLPFFGLTEKRRTPRSVIPVRRLLHSGLGLLLLYGLFRALPGAGSSSSPSAGPAPLLEWIPPVALALLASAMVFFLLDHLGLFAPRPASRMYPIVGYIRASHLYLALLAAALLLVALGMLIPRLVPESPLGALSPGSLVLLGFLAAAGWLSNSILGYLHRILPFFVWHNKYWGRGKEPGVPAFRDMVNPRVAWIGFGLYNAGVMTVMVSLVLGWPLKAGLLLLGTGSLLAAGNLLRMYWR